MILKQIHELDALNNEIERIKRNGFEVILRDDGISLNHKDGSNAVYCIETLRELQMFNLGIKIQKGSYEFLKEGK